MQTAARIDEKEAKHPLSCRRSLRSSFFMIKQFFLGHEKQERDSVAALHPFKVLELDS